MEDPGFFATSAGFLIFELIFVFLTNGLITERRARGIIAAAAALIAAASGAYLGVPVSLLVLGFWSARGKETPAAPESAPAPPAAPETDKPPGDG